MNNFDRRKENLKRVLTCGICKKLYKNVTIIEECCHRFCKKCITKKIIEEKLKVCPECNQDLGVAPLQKIRPDHQMQGIRDVLSRKRREFIERGLIQRSKKGKPKMLAREVIDLNNSADMLIDNPSSPPPPPAPIVATSSRRKQKSIASLVNTTSLVVDYQVLSQQNVWSSSTGGGRGRGRGSERGRRRGNSLNLDDYEDEDVDDDDEEEDEEYVPFPKLKDQKVSKQNVVQRLVVVQAIEAPSIRNIDKGKGKKGLHGRKKKETSNPSPAPALTPAPALVPVPPLAPSPVLAPTPALAHAPAPPLVLALVPDCDGGDSGTNINVAQVGVNIEAAGGTSSGSTRVLNERVHPIWLTLVACDKQECTSPLPQISSRYIKIKDGDIPASYIKKYLANKLGLQNEDKVKIHMLGMLIRPSLPLKHLAKLWLHQTSNSEKHLAKVGASAQEFVMVLKYCRSDP